MAEKNMEIVEKVELADFETAIHYAGYGKFQTILLAICGFVYATCCISTTTLSFVLPSAECDFQLSSAEKGKLSAMPLIGMVVGSAIWGGLADSFGRKIAIVLSLLVDFTAATLSAFSNTFHMLLIFRFFNGFGIIGATSIIFSYLGEFLSVKHRDTFLCRLEVFWDLGAIFLPALAWIVLTQDYKYPWLVSYEASTFSSWKIFLLVCGVPSLISALILCFLPETPKYFISKRKFQEALAVFKKVYVCNTGQDPDTYPVCSLQEDGDFNCNSIELEKQTLKRKFYRNCRHACVKFKDLFTAPYLKYILLACFIDFGLISSYFTLIMWFPDLFERFEQYEALYPKQQAGICHVSDVVTRYEDTKVVKDFCSNALNTNVFVYTLIIGLSCVPCSVFLSVFIEKLSKKTLLVSTLLVSGVSTLALNWVQSANQTLALSSIFEALTSISEAVLFCVVVDLFPTYLRALALSLTATSGRIGAIFGNYLFGILVDLNCVVPIYTFGILLVLSALLCLAIPQSRRYIVIP